MLTVSFFMELEIMVIEKKYYDIAQRELEEMQREINAEKAQMSEEEAALEIAEHMSMNIKTERKEDDLWGTIEFAFENMWFLDTTPPEWVDTWNTLLKEAHSVYIEIKNNMIVYQYSYDLSKEVII